MFFFNWRLWVGVGLLVLLVAAAAYIHRHGKAEVQAAWDAERAAVIEATRAEENRRRVNNERVGNEANKKLVAARADAVRARAALDGVRDQLAAVTAGNPPVAEGGDASGDAVGVLAELLGRAATRMELLARHADESRIAGEACVRSYEGLVKAD